MSAIENSRPEFEMWVSSSPFEYNIDRYHDSAAFPGAYKSIRVDLAWCAWQEAGSKVKELQSRVAELEAEREEFLLDAATHIGNGNKAVRRIKAQAIRDAANKLCAIRDGSMFSKLVSFEELNEHATQIDGQSNET